MYSSYPLNNDHKSSLSIVFHRSDKGQNKKRHEDNGFVSLSLCLKTTRTTRGEDNDDHKSLWLSFVFHRNDKGKKQAT